MRTIACNNFSRASIRSLKEILGSNFCKNSPIIKKSRYIYEINISHLCNTNRCYILYSFLQRHQNFSILLYSKIRENKLIITKFRYSLEVNNVGFCVPKQKLVTIFFKINTCYDKLIKVRYCRY